MVRNYLALGVVCPGSSITGLNLWTANNPVAAGLEAPELPASGPAAQIPSDWFIGGWVQLPYIPGSEQEFPPGMPEWERHTRGLQLFQHFVRRQPSAFVKLLGYKLKRFIVAKPPRPAAVDMSPTAHRLRTAAEKAERWLALAVGGLGLAFLFRYNRPLAYLAVAFLLGNVALILASYPSARLFMPGTSVLVIAASGLVPRPSARAASDSIS